MTKENQPRVSVVIPAYNAEDLVGHALESVLSQTYSAHEIIVVDDGSTDGTWKVVRAFGEGVRHVYQENAGPSVARNTGIEEATGDWVAFVDSDDIWLPEKLEQDVAVLGQLPDLVWVASNHYLCPFGTDDRFVRFDTSRVPQQLVDNRVFPSYFGAIAYGLGWDPLGLFIRRDVLLDAGGFRPGLNYGEDLDLCLTIARKHPKIGFQPEPSAVHFIDRPEGLCRQQPIVKHMRTLREMFDRHLESLPDNEVRSCLATVFKTIAQDNMFVLLAEGRRLDILRVRSLFAELLPGRYAPAMIALSLLPPALRKRLYGRMEWSIR